MRRHLQLLLSALTVAACGDVSGSIGGGPGPSASQALELSLALTDEVESAIAAATVARAGSPPGWSPPPGCPTLTGTTDADGDGIPDNGTWSFASPPCVGSFRDGSIEITGTLGISDPSQANGTAYTLAYDDLRWDYIDSAGSLDYAATRNGTRSRTGSADAASLTSDLRIIRERPGRTDAIVDWDGTTGFTAQTPGTVILGQPAPSGTLSLAGTLRWQRSTEDWTLAVATPVALTYNASCTETPRISAGQLTLTGTISGEGGVLRFTWSQCGVRPVATWIAGAD